MILAQVAFTVMVVFVKIVRQDLSTVETAFWRSAFAIPLLILWARKQSWHIQDKPAILFRTLFGFGALCSFFGAAKGLSVADLSLISKVQPLLVALLAPIILGSREKASSRLWWLMLLAMVGCSILLAPELRVGSWYGVLAILAAIFSGHAHVFVRRLKSENPLVVVLWFQTGSGLLALVTCLFTMGGISIPSTELLPLLFGIGVTATLGQWFMTMAYKREKAAVVAVASYGGPLMAVFADAIAFRVLPSWNGYIGGAIIIVAGVFLIRSTK